MPCYRQIKREYEAGTGWVTAELVISDSYANLFTQTGVQDVDIFKFNSSKEDLEKNGSQKEDEFNFEISDSKIKTTADQDARDFVLTAETANIWIALFCYETDPYTSGTVADLKLSGKVRPNISGTNIFSQGSQWGSAPDPLREWKVSAASLGSAVLDKINMADEMVDGELVQGLLSELAEETAWISTYVYHPISYDGGSPGGLDDIIKTNNLVDMNRALNKLRLLAIDRIQTDIPTFDLTFKASQSGFWFVPGKANVPIPFKFTGWDNNPADKARLNLLDLTATNNIPLVNINLLLTGFGIADEDKQEQQKSLEKGYSWERYDNFKALLYALAPCFGCFCIFRNLTGTHIEVEFVPQGDVETARVYLCDFIAGDLDLQTEQIKDKRFKGRAHYAAVEGNDYYTVDTFTLDSNVFKSEKSKGAETEKGNLLPVSVSPTLMYAKSYQYYNWMPHNGYHQSIRGNGPIFIHTAIYMGHLQGGTDYRVTPVCQVAASIDGDELIHDTLSGLLNELDGINGTVHKTEYRRKLPWITRFSLSADGSSQSWKNLVIGSEYIEDGRSYLVAGIERDWDKFETTLRLTRTSKYAFSEPVGVIEVVLWGGGEHWFLPSSGQAGEALESGNAGIIDSDGKIYKMLAHHDHYGKYAGIILNEPSESDEVYLQDDKTLYNPAWDLTPGKLVYVRTSVDINLSHDSILEKTDDEDLVICIGKATGVSEIKLEKMFESIIWPPLGGSL